MRPRAILLDLDDTILDDSSLVHECWREACVDQAHRFAPLDQAVIVEAIRTTSRWYWGDADRHRTGRLELEAARREVVSIALTELGIDDASLAAAIGDAYSHRRDAGMEPLPEAIDTVRWLRDSGRRLALVTNGAGRQAKEIRGSRLADFFDVILIEGEMGFGKPDSAIPQHWWLDVRRPMQMVGDNLEWDVAAPQKLGIAGIWIDLRGRGVPEESTVRPDHVVKGLSELRSLIENPSRPLFL
jgi:putative hydrolase of the HAD superfamily